MSAQPTRPNTVAVMRGLGYAALTALVAAAIALTPADLETIGPFAPVLVLLARVGEALLLDRRQPLQAGPLGGAPATPPADVRRPGRAYE